MHLHVVQVWLFGDLGQLGWGAKYVLTGGHMEGEGQC